MTKGKVIGIEPISIPTRVWESGTIRIELTNDYLIFESNGKVTYSISEDNDEIVYGGRHFSRADINKGSILFSLSFFNKREPQNNIDLLQTEPFHKFPICKSYFKLYIYKDSLDFVLLFKHTDKDKAIKLIKQIKDWQNT